MICEEWTFQDLLAWANSLNLCEFRKDRRFGVDEALCEGRDGSIRLRLSRFSEAASIRAGMRAVGINVEDKRAQGSRPWHGMGYISVNLKDIERDIERYGTRLNLLNPQMSLF